MQLIDLVGCGNSIPTRLCLAPDGYTLLIATRPIDAASIYHNPDAIRGTIDTSSPYIQSIDLRKLKEISQACKVGGRIMKGSVKEGSLTVEGSRKIRQSIQEDQPVVIKDSTTQFLTEGRGSVCIQRWKETATGTGQIEEVDEGIVDMSLVQDGEGTMAMALRDGMVEAYKF